ncbi:Uncharacterised protein [Bordetella pertussis]|nr:Uncharacterised protein [Bordetella pertussis]
MVPISTRAISPSKNGATTRTRPVRALSSSSPTTR